MGYLISAYFDEETNHTLSGYIRETANVSGNDFMIYSFYHSEDILA